jgi:gas vesicle protein
MLRRLAYFGIGCAVGVAFGIVGGVLIAPTSGRETRRRLAAQAFRAARAARTVADQAEITAEGLGERFEHYMGRDEEVAWRKVREIRESVDRYTQAQAQAL